MPNDEPRAHGGKACYKWRMGDPENIPFCLKG